MLEPIERARDRRRRTELRLYDHDVLGRGRPHAELAQHAVQRLARVALSSSPRKHVARPSKGVARLLQAQLANVARNCRLRHPAPRLCEGFRQLELAPDAAPRDDACDQPLPL
jgi:hypothetical protein